MHILHQDSCFSAHHGLGTRNAAAPALGENLCEIIHENADRKHTRHVQSDIRLVNGNEITDKFGKFSRKFQRKIEQRHQRSRNNPDYTAQSQGGKKSPCKVTFDIRCNYAIVFISKRPTEHETSPPSEIRKCRRSDT